LSLFGNLGCSRAYYYYCRRGGWGHCPFDATAGLTDRHLTPAVERLATLAGAGGDSSQRGAELLAEMAGVRLSEATVQRATADAGQRLEALWAAGTPLGPAVTWQWYPDHHGRRVAYGTIDATGTRQQAPGGGAAEGRLAYGGGVYNPPPEYPVRAAGRPAPRLQARYVSGLYTLAAMGPLLRRQAAHVGMEQADIWVALTDGGSGLEDFVQTNVNRPELVVILDFYHAASYLEELARALYPQEEEPARQQAQAWCRLLKEEGGATTLAVLREWSWPARQSAALRQQRHKTEEYFEKNLHRMEYPEYQAQGWQIGSGVVESACQTVVGWRLKGAGRRWSEAAAHALCHVRALERSDPGQWEAFWKRQFTKRAVVQVPSSN
jgi:hypothetical protein